MFASFFEKINDQWKIFLNTSALFYWVLLLSGLYLASLYSYLFFHSLVEMFSIVIACGIFMLAWNSRHLVHNGFFGFIGIAYLFTGGLDLVHLLSYKGMGVFPGYGSNLPTQLWIAARYVQSLSLLLAPSFLGRRLRYSSAFFVYFLATLLLLGSIFSWEIFPDCYIEGSGLTLFKKVSEYIISLLFLAALIRLRKRRQEFDPGVLRLLILSILLTILAEMAFTFYIGVYDLSNMIGHYLKLMAFYLIYKAIIETGLVKPYDLLFRNLKQSEEALRRAHDELEMRVQQRTAELTRVNEALQGEIFERKRAEGALRESEVQYSRLVESSLTGININQDGKIFFANNKFAEIYGYSKEELVGKEMRDLVHPDDRLMTDDIRERRLKKEAVPSAYESRGLTKDGRIIWVNMRNTLIEYQGRPAILGNIVEITQRKQIEEALKASERELRRLSSQLLMAQENERKWIAQELHDSIGQILAATKFSLERKLQMAHGQAPPGISLEDILSMLQNGIDETRRIMTHLRPSILDDLGILATINWFCREFQKAYGHIQIQREIEIEEGEIPPPLKIIIFRILQEGMNNFAKHGRGDRLCIVLRKQTGALEFMIKDNGIGFDVKNCSKGMGLASMKERTELSGGILTIDSAPGTGACVRASWPV